MITDSMGRASMSIDTDYEVLRWVLDEHQPQGWAIEFGVYSGYSLAIIAEHMPVIGLDSFAGLPEDWREGFPKGTFNVLDEPSLGLDLLPPANAMIVPGWFEDTLPVLTARGLPQLGLVHIDCDLYSSTVTALEGVLPFIGSGTFIVFDEFHGYDGWEKHEAKAWDEFCHRHLVVSGAVANGDQEKAFVISQIGGSR